MLTPTKPPEVGSPKSGLVFLRDLNLPLEGFQKHHSELEGLGCEDPSYKRAGRCKSLTAQ